jgi:hypothetical protein
VQDLLEQVPSDVPVAMVTFAGEAGETIDFSKGRQGIAAWLKAVPTEGAYYKSYRGSPRLFDSISSSLKLLEPFQTGDAIFVITDGKSHSAAKQARADLLESGVRLFSFFFSEPEPGETVPREASDFMDLVRDSGGSLFSLSGTDLDAPSRVNTGGTRGPDSTSDTSNDYEHLLSRWVYVFDERTKETIKAYTRDLNGHLSGFYAVRIAPESRKESRVELKVIDGVGRARKDLGFTYPRMLPATK